MSYKNGQGRDRTVIHNLFHNNTLCNLENPCAAKSVALLETPAFSDDDRRALEAVITAWPTLAPETKIGILHMVEAASRVSVAR